MLPYTALLRVWKQLPAWQRGLPAAAASSAGCEEYLGGGIRLVLYKCPFVHPIVECTGQNEWKAHLHCWRAAQERVVCRPRFSHTVVWDEKSFHLFKGYSTVTQGTFSCPLGAATGLCLASHSQGSRLLNRLRVWYKAFEPFPQPLANRCGFHSE